MTVEKQLRDFLYEKPTLDEWKKFSSQFDLINMPLRKVWEAMIHQIDPDLDFIKNCGLNPHIQSDIVYFCCAQVFCYNQPNPPEINKELFTWASSQVKKKSIMKNIKFFFKQYQGNQFIPNNVLNYLENHCGEKRPQERDKFLKNSILAQLTYTKRYEQPTHPDTIENYLNLYSRNKELAVSIENLELLSIAKSVELQKTLDNNLETKNERKKMKI